MKAIYPHDSPVTVPVLRYRTEDGSVRLRSRYEDLACAECGKVDEVRALQRGIDASITFKSDRDIFGSLADFYIINDRVRTLISSVQHADVSYYSFPSAPGYQVAMPKAVYHPQKDDSAFRFAGAGKCQTCGRESWIGWGAGTPSVPADTPIGMIHAETQLGISPIIYGSEEMITVLRQATPRLRIVVFLPLGRGGAR